MKNVRVEYRVDATINIGDFQNIKPGFTISADVEEDENPVDVKNKLVTKADEWLDREVTAIRDKRK